MKIDTNKADIAHEATVGKIGEEIYYLMSRINKEQATQMVVNGFIAPVIKGLPLEYAAGSINLLS